LKLKFINNLEVYHVRSHYYHDNSVSEWSTAVLAYNKTKHHPLEWIPM